LLQDLAFAMSGTGPAAVCWCRVGSDVDLYNAVLDACELIFRLTAQAQSRSTAITTTEVILFRLPVAGHPPYKVFWSSDGPRIETVFPQP
jgi:hypothetical protein